MPTDLRRIICQYVEPSCETSCLRYTDHLKLIKQRKLKINPQYDVADGIYGLLDQWINPNLTISLRCIYLDPVPDYIDLSIFDPTQFISDVKGNKSSMLDIGYDTLFWDAEKQELATSGFVVTGKAIDFVLQWLGNIKSQTEGKQIFIIN